MNKEDLKQHIFEFSNLIIVILRRQALFWALEKSLEYKATQEEVEKNEFVAYYTTDYTRAQLTDLRKFFAANPISYRISELIDFLGDSELESRHEELFKKWKLAFEDVANKLIMHIDKDSGRIDRKIQRNNLDLFINEVNQFISLLFDKLRDRGTLVIEKEVKDLKGNIKRLDEKELRNVNFHREESKSQFEQFLEWANSDRK